MNILITGGGFRNKGAQSMLFITVAQMAKRYPKDDIVLMSLVDVDSSNLRFGVEKIKYPALKVITGRAGMVSSFMNRVRKADIALLESLYSSARLQIDISGYALGSNWSRETVDYYLLCIECAKKFDVPVYLMPQSFGPFDFDEGLKARIQETLSSCRAIFAREEAGYSALVEGFSLGNVRRSVDMVLANASAKPEEVFRFPQTPEIPKIRSGSIAVIPNVKNSETVENALSLYINAVSWLVENGRNVYLIYHSKEDAATCQEIKDAFGDEDRVVLLDKDFSCFEYEVIVRKFAYIVASRYHSLVHALKNGRPCVAIGWADKYEELLRVVGLGDFSFDVRKGVSKEALEATLGRMDAHYPKYAETIVSAVSTMSDVCMFDAINSIKGRE